MIHQALRHHTHDAHEALHIHPLLAPLASGHITLKGYQHCLNAFFNAYRAMETARIVPNIYDFPDASVLDLLEADMACEGISPSLTSFPHPPVDSLSKLVGYLYVKQGSTLGGQMIAKNLSRQLGVTNRFFAGYQKDTASEWKRFLGIVERHENRLSHAETLESAKQAFATIKASCDMELLRISK